MTELNNLPEAGDGGSPVGDASVDAVLARLDNLQALPVEQHAEAYSALHDALLDALNEDNPSAAGDA
ncbi:hypothetical protein [Arthrobacter sp. B10-11]|uniref:hypothetical protein n=1 Tax=Arthrobacter sp. B10-11 TaxID=3081160 RepID=UPI00295360A3|nr:hypothetical protein [Arthrobacter sp. B10-11]MDV8148630.1 hypothetical protein [Arthrobacter sp. B10-11]